ncbi:MAG: RNA pseudouridine synthase [Deltaproteobacteria bacterium]|jgi:23S rRNA pseudouridine1911/1915/1917 synthase|nr:RNA pseudouridine synthase [Deltaproteobacteria bacterium]
MREHEDVTSEKKILTREVAAEQGGGQLGAVCEVSAGQDGERLDAVLADLFPELGLRARRRLWEWRTVTVNGTPRPPAYKVRPGQVVQVLSQKVEGASPELSGPSGLPESSEIRKSQPSSGTQQKPIIRLIAMGGGFAALAKPAGLPSAALAGGNLSSAEALLNSGWAGLWRDFTAASSQTLHAAQSPQIGQEAQMPPETPLLCNRLDTATSGLLLLSFGPERREFFRACERRGEAVKKYLALAHGRTPQSLLLDRAMDTDGRRISKVLDCAEPDRTRHTAVTLLQFLDLDQPGLRGEFSLLEVQIWRGSRHQIRAHLAAAGFPLAGDPLYGPETPPDVSPDRLYLHHFELILPEFSASCPPDWEFV